MNYQNAMDMVYLGRKMKREAWDRNMYIFVRGGILSMYSSEYICDTLVEKVSAYYPEEKDRLANDWIEV